MTNVNHTAVLGAGVIGASWTALFLASGRKVPRTGGVIFAHGRRNDIEAYVAADPFTLHGVCTYEITEVAVTRVAGGGLDALKS